MFDLRFCILLTLTLFHSYLRIYLFAAGSAPVDATQEMIAIGMCNLVSSFAQSMPSTGSFTRTALNHASGVVTPAGCFFKGTPASSSLLVDDGKEPQSHKGQKKSALPIL